MNTIPYFDPATGKELGRIEVTPPEEVLAAYDRATKAFPEWSRKSISERISHLKKGQKWLMENIDRVSDAISANNGKPRVEAMMSDVYPALTAINWYAKNAEKILADEKIGLFDYLPSKKAFLSFSPLGVVGIISPWNYPFSIPMGEIIAGLVAGNCILIKPSEVTSLVNQQIRDWAKACEFPQNVFQMIEGDGTTGAALCNLPLGRIVFTGSVATGKRIMKAAAEHLTPVSLELGGKDPAIIFEDANIDSATSGVLFGGLVNNGQTCCSIERLLVHKSIEKPFIDMLKAKAEKLRVGPSTGYENELGPISFSPQKKVIKHQLDEFEGGSSLYDGESPFLRPVIIKTGEAPLIWNEETFGPVICYDTFESESEAASKANRNQFGLAAVVWSANIDRAKKFARTLYTGTVVINDGPFTNAVAPLPWGGVKNSGFGKVHGKEGLRDMCLQRVITWDLQGQAKQLWYYPYSKGHYDFMKSFALFASDTRWLSKISNLIQMIARLLKLEKRL